MSDDNVYTLTELQHAETGDGPWRIYIYGKDGYHHGATRFSRTSAMDPENRTIPLDEARDREHFATKGGLEVRITDTGDMLVFHSQGGKVIYGENFWKEAEGNG